MENLSFLDKKTLTAVIGAIKRSFTFNSIDCKLAMDDAMVNEGPRGGARWICNYCNSVNVRKDINVDHIEPCIPTNRAAAMMTLKEIYERCFVDSERLQVLCKDCHKKKNDSEKSERKIFRNLNKLQTIKNNKEKNNG